MKNTARTRSDCNWIVKESARMRKDLGAARLVDVTDLEQRIAIKLLIRSMDYNELKAALYPKS